ncbi:MAG: hypothetical protein H7Y00_10235 [Fimbriimonadaceae bacterium]|nr:hypothetical protein [Chitinophagales bacterium]
MKNVSAFLTILFITITVSGLRANNLTSMPGEKGKIEIVITPQTTKAELEKIAEQLADEGIKFKVSQTNYNDGLLTDIAFEIKAEGMNGNYANNDIQKGDKIYLVIDKSKNSLHIGSSPNPKCAGACTSKCTKAI